MKHVKVWSALGLMTMAGVAQAAGLSSTLTVTNDYDFRGISQTAEDPALQASVDYAGEGWYVGAWGSNVDFGDSTDLELDLYGGFSGKTDMGLGWDAGLVLYNYDESRYNFQEIYTAFTYDWFKGKLAYSNDFGGRSDSPPRHRSGFYASGDANVPLPANFSFLAHLGYSFGNYWDHNYAKYFDYAVGVGYTVQKIDLALKYVDTEPSGDTPHITTDVFNNEARLILTASTTFSW